jgi:hypothetical protein
MESAQSDDTTPVSAPGAVSVLPQRTPLEPRPTQVDPAVEEELQAAFRSELDDPELVVAPGYIGHDRRASGWRARLARATFHQRRSLLTLEFAVAAVVLLLVLVTVLQVGTRSHPTAAATATVTRVHTTVRRAAVPAPTTTAPAPTTTAPAPTTTVPAPTTTVPAPAPVAPPAAVAPAAAAAPAPAAAAPAPAATTPDQLGQQALALVRYPWQNIPGYSIQFLPISDAPSPGFYGNTTFTWGRTGGTSVLYVYAGETVDTLAGIIGFEIGHEVDAAAVEPQGGEAQIENILGIRPASWAPDCDCAEQGFLSGWYAAAFSNYWSPGVGDWSTIAPEPSGSVLAAIEPWLNPTIS